MVSLIGCVVSYKRRKPIVSIDIMTNKSSVVNFVAKSIRSKLSEPAFNAKSTKTLLL